VAHTGAPIELTARTQSLLILVISGEGELDRPGNPAEAFTPQTSGHVQLSCSAAQTCSTYPHPDSKDLVQHTWASCS
jgi:hypothetical protein